MRASHRRRLVVKLGTQVVIEQSRGEVARDCLRAVADDIAKLMRQGYEAVLVSSGAVGLGRLQLGLSGKLELAEKQACAALGQARLMALYSELFAAHKIKVAQVLLTAHDFSDRNRYLNLRNAFERLLGLGVLPVVNENDVVSVAGLIDTERRSSFDDNDKLSALVAGKLDADSLVILTNVAGVYTGNPAEDAGAVLIREVRTLAELAAIDTAGQSALGRGGMDAKLNAARVAALCGVRTVISSGFAPSPVVDALAGRCGTAIHSAARMRGRKRWIGLSSGYSGVVTVDERAKEMLIQQNRSLLPVGVTSVAGSFEVGDIVSIRDEQGHEIGRGIVSQRSSSLRKIRGMRSPQLKDKLGADEKTVAVHRDNLVLFHQGSESRAASTR
jgi:glutamate 5-kinase